MDGDGLLGFTDGGSLVAPAAAPAMAMDPMSFMAPEPTPDGASPPAAVMAMPAAAAPAPAMAAAPAAAPAAAYADPFQGMPMKDPSSMGGSPAVGGGAIGGIPEMNKLREWEDKHEKELEEMSRKEEAAKKERRAKAAEELKKWYDERAQNITKRIAANKAEQATVEQSRDEAAKGGSNSWARVVDLIDTNARSADECRDTSRMRSLLIQLKSNPVA
eukprot:TRINITY_DN4354_c0_g2_i1.p2 TRINITY_DN4354_c0_g2~~TRINITY_DN4354_c0_g2_i1.p2  ORF type:complete len:217 (+),score=74.78 TRINITY_DN4354_c0_g2_i1:52-702(+)